MIKHLAFLALFILLHASLIPTQDSPQPLPLSSTAPTASESNSIKALEVIQQHILNTYSSNNPNTPQANISQNAGLNSSSLQAIKQEHNSLMTDYFKNNKTINIDNGVNNTINGVRNIIQQGDQNSINGTENLLKGNSNQINGDHNNVNGNKNQINSQNNVVYGSGNVIMDKPGSYNSKPLLPPTPNATAPTSSISLKDKGITNSEVNSQPNLSNQFGSFLLMGIWLVVLHLCSL